MKKKRSNFHARLVCLFYLLMRDEMPTGRLVNIIKEIEKKGPPYVYTAYDLAEYARVLVKRLKSEK